VAGDDRPPRPKQTIRRSGTRAHRNANPCREQSPAAAGERAAQTCRGHVESCVCAFAAAGAADVEREVELAAVVEAVVGSAERDDTVGVVAAAVLARDEVGWVDRGTVADDARELGDVGSLLR
jgi:hypothetical protein